MKHHLLNLATQHKLMIQYKLVTLIAILLSLPCLSAAFPHLVSLAELEKIRHIATSLLYTSALAQSAGYSYEDTTPAAINESSTPCTAPLIRTLTVTDDFVITDLNVGLTISHTYRGDLRITLRSPRGTRVLLITNTLSDSHNNFDLLLDSGVTNRYNDRSNDSVAAPYYDRTAAPENSLDAVNGENALGIWQVEICDAYTYDSGALQRILLRFEGTAPATPTATKTSTSTATATRTPTPTATSIPTATPTVTSTPLPRADLSIVKYDAVDPMIAGTTLTYTIIITNYGPDEARDVVMTDTLPLRTTFVIASSSCIANGGIVRCSIGAIAANTAVTITIVVFADPTLTDRRSPLGASAVIWQPPSPIPETFYVERNRGSPSAFVWAIELDGPT